MSENVAGAFRSLPMRELIGAPFRAACDSQMLLADAYFNYVEKIGYEDDGKTTRLLAFNLDQPVTDANGNMTKMNIDVKAPYLGLIPIPALLIDDMTVDFTMTVASSEKSTDSSTETASTGGSGGFFGVNFHFSASVTASQERIRTSNQSATYTVHVGARQQPQTEGMSRLMDVMASCIVPMKAA